MRFLILAVLPLAALLAQAPPPAEPTQQKTETPAETAPPTQAERPTKPDAVALAALQKKLKLLLQAPIDLRTRARVTVLRPGQPCAVPLKNMLRTAPAPPVLDPLPVTPGNPGAVPLKEVAVPAPSCGDVQR